MANHHPPRNSNPPTNDGLSKFINKSNNQLSDFGNPLKYYMREASGAAFDGDDFHGSNYPMKSRFPTSEGGEQSYRKSGLRVERIWKTAFDPISGKTYYYDAVTRETQWRKPMELANLEERTYIVRKEQKQRQFFAAMESNILKSLELGEIPGMSSPGESSDKLGPEVGLRKRHVLNKPACISVRTISAMNENVLKELVPTNVKSPSSIAQLESTEQFPSFSDDDTQYSIDDFGTDEFLDKNDDYLQEWVRKGTQYNTMSLLDQAMISEENYMSGEHSQLNKSFNEISLNQNTLPKHGKNNTTMSNAENKPHSITTNKRPSLGVRRNTCGRVNVGSTLSEPDKEATIKCVCAVYRAHILQSIKELEENEYDQTYFEEYEIFNDFKIHEPKSSLTLSRRDSSDTLVFQEEYDVDVPTLDQITYFYREIFLTSKMESDCVIISLIYIEKIMKATNGGVRPTANNWRSLLFSSMILASKVWDDLSMWNVDFTKACPKGVIFSLQRINELEKAILECLNYKVKVLASEYAKYYFLLRSMMIQSELSENNSLTSLPLDMDGAQRLEKNSSTFGTNIPSTIPKLVRRSRSFEYEKL